MRSDIALLRVLHCIKHNNARRRNSEFGMMQVKVPLQSYVNQREPGADALVWRFLDIPKFRDLMANEELYFRRADRFKMDPNESVPPDDWIRESLGLRKFVLEDEMKLRAEKGSLAQFRECSYLSCWHLFEGEDPEMWKEFCPYGVAAVTRYELLRETLKDLIDPVHIGLARYGYGRGERYNHFTFMYTKGREFQKEREVRILMSCYDPAAGMNRHYDINNIPHERPLKENRLHKWVADGKRRRIEVKPLVTGLVVSPWANSRVFAEVKFWAKARGLECEPVRSGLRGKTLPSLRQLADLKRKRA